MNDWANPSVERWTLAALAVGFLTAGAAFADPSPSDSTHSTALDGRVIRSVEIEPRDVFEPVPSGRLAPIYRLANSLHIRSRESTVRAHLILHPGETWSARRGRQQERLLRELEFLQPDRVRAVPAGDSVDVPVRTSDAWTTQPLINIESGGGDNFGTFGVTERNLLGLGKEVALSYSEIPTGISRAILYEDPAVFGTAVHFRYQASNGTSGANDMTGVWQPFVYEDSPRTWGLRWTRTGSTAHMFDNGEEVAIFARDVNDLEAWLGMGGRDDGNVRRLTLAFNGTDRRFGPSAITPGAPTEFAGAAEQERFRNLRLVFRLWRPRFLERPDVNRPDRLEDLDVGHSATLEAGYSPQAFGATNDEGWVGALLDFGIETGMGYAVARTRLTTRLHDGPVETIRSADLRWVTQAGRHTLVTSAYGIAGSDVPRDFQIVVGGLNGLRAYPVHALGGRELVRFNAEERWLVGRDISGLFSLGLAGFWDVARAWGPGAEGTDWFHDAGIGIRLSPPSAAFGNILRFDVAWPISPSRDGGHEAVFTFGSAQAF